MADVVIVAVITLIGTIVSAYISSKSTSNKITHELRVSNEIQNVKIEHITNEIAEIKRDLKATQQDVKEHNNYGKKFLELKSDFQVGFTKQEGEIALMSEKIEVANKRIKDLELN